MIADDVRRQLLALARDHLEARVRGYAAPSIPRGLAIASSGVFVTLYCRNELRGCLGSLDPADPVADAIARLAAAVCRDDRRFDPLQAGELSASALELSVLTPPERIVDPAAIEVGRHGLIAERGGRKGLLLPQVAPEHGWDRETFLAHTCIKAGLNGDAWKRDAIIYVFEAEVFGERER